MDVVDLQKDLKDRDIKSYLSADFDYWACETFKSRFKKSKVINEDITSDKFKAILKKQTKGVKIDGVVAGTSVSKFF